MDTTPPVRFCVPPCAFLSPILCVSVSPNVSLAQQSIYEVSQLFVGSVFALELSVKYLKVTFSCAQKPVKFRSGFIYYENVN